MDYETNIIKQDNSTVNTTKLISYKMLMCKYQNLNSDAWSFDVIHDQNLSSQMPEINFRRQNYFNIQKDNILEHSLSMTNECNWLEPSDICDKIKFNPNQIKKLSLSIKQNSYKLSLHVQYSYRNIRSEF